MICFFADDDGCLCSFTANSQLGKIVQNAKHNENAVGCDGATAGPMKVLSISARWNFQLKAGDFGQIELFLADVEQSWQEHVEIAFNPYNIHSSVADMRSV